MNTFFKMQIFIPILGCIGRSLHACWKRTYVALLVGSPSNDIITIKFLVGHTFSNGVSIETNFRVDF